MLLAVFGWSLCDVAVVIVFCCCKCFGGDGAAKFGFIDIAVAAELIVCCFVLRLGWDDVVCVGAGLNVLVLLN